MAEQHLKRAHPSDHSARESDDSDDDDDFGPSLPSTEDPSTNISTTDEPDSAGHPKLKSIRKKKKVEHEQVRKLMFVFSCPTHHPQLFLDNLPSCPQYERSYMHRDNVTHVVISKQYDYLITGSCDGHIKFWKKMLQGVEFVKHYQAHLGAITGLAIAPNDQKLVTIGEDR
jgi:peptidylprolyl isomerase domain and WD repeat-containing protein 1